MEFTTKLYGQSDDDRPLAIDLFCGLGGWTDGLLAENWRVIGFDNERHVYGEHRYPAQLVLQDVLTLHGRQFKDAALIVASPPCQEYSYMAMPWSRGKQIRRALLGEDEFPSGYKGSRTKAELTALFDACFRIQQEAIEAAGRFIPLVVENVKGAQDWVGRSRWNYGSFHLYGDVPALMPMTKAIKNPDCKTWYPPDDPRHQPNQRFNRLEGQKVPGFRFDGSGKSFQTASVEGTKTVGHANKRDGHSHTRHLTNQAESDGVKRPGIKFSEEGFNCTLARQISPTLERGSVKLSPEDRRQHLSSARKAASAMIAKIPLPLARHIARSWMPA